MKVAKEKLFKGEPLDENLSKKVEEAKGKLEEVLKSANLQLLGKAKREKLNEAMEEIMAVNRDIEKEIEKVIEKKGSVGRLMR